MMVRYPLTRLSIKKVVFTFLEGGGVITMVIVCYTVIR